MSAPENLEQKTAEWYAKRLGKCTASKVADATAKIKTGEAASRAEYRTALVVERLTGTPQGADLSNNKSVQWGNDAEPLARAAFEADTGLLVQEVGFINHPTLLMAGASPDGLISDDSILEIKCPNSSTHFSYLKDGKVPAKYRKQMMWQIICTGRSKGIFVSFDPRFDSANQLLVVNFEPSKDELAELEAEVKAFLDEVEADYQWAKNRSSRAVYA